MAFSPPDQISQAFDREWDKMVTLVQNIIDSTFHYAEFDCLKKPGEVERLAYFFIAGLPALEQGLNNLLIPHRVRVIISGVFCHQTPKVVAMTPKIGPSSCELGDILFLSTYGQPVGPETDGIGNGIIVQAKNDYYSSSDEVQDYLYDEASSFRYSSPISLRGKIRDVPQDGAIPFWFWDFETKIRPWRTRGIRGRCPGGKAMAVGDLFARVIVALFRGYCGRGFKLPGGNSWSQIVNDLVGYAVESSFSRRRAYITRNERQPRAFNVINYLRSGGPPATLLRCSLAEFLAPFGPRMKEYGAKLERENKEFGWQDFDNGPPSNDIPLNRGFDDDNPGGGGSFVVFQFSNLG